MRGNVVDLAIGIIIIGLAFGAIVSSLVKDILNPIIGLVIGGVDFSNIFVVLNGQHYDTLDAAQKAGAPTLNIGVFIDTIISDCLVRHFLAGQGGDVSLHTQGGGRSGWPDPDRGVASGNPRPFGETACRTSWGREDR